MLTEIGQICLTIIIIIAIIISLWLMIRSIKLLNTKIYHWRNPKMPKLKSKLLYGYLKEKYGRSEGKRIHKEIKNKLWDRFKIK